MDTNPDIRVERTDADTLQCFRLVLGESSFLLHARDLHDLNRKAGLALLDWIADTTRLALEADLRRLGLEPPPELRRP